MILAEATPRSRGLERAREERARQARERKRESVKKVDVFMVWLRSGSKGRMPCLPSDLDFQAWHEAQPR